MRNIHQTREDNIQSFRNWVDAHSDEALKEYEYRGQLSRTEIAKKCKFGKSALQQNPTIRIELEALENWLRYKGILPHIVGNELDVRIVEKSNGYNPARPDPDKSSIANDDPAKWLHLEIASLKTELKRYKEYMQKYDSMEKFMIETLRMPR